ncbi:MAG: GNAT superfamily N-acetyltransferase [Paraglaciecola sp.]|jgi:GNAT superfamily N-acetyltransferase
MSKVYVLSTDDGVKHTLKTFFNSFNIEFAFIADIEAVLPAAKSPLSGCVLIDRPGDYHPLLANKISLPVLSLPQPFSTDALVARLLPLFAQYWPGLNFAASLTHVLRDGTAITIRPVEPQDRQVEQDFVTHLSLRSRQRRFLYGLRKLSEVMLDNYVHIHYPDNMAFIATRIHAGQEQQIAETRYAKTSAKTAECAIAVADAWQRRGIATLLLAHTLNCARSTDFAHLQCCVLADNYPMQALARKFAVTVTPDPDDDTLVNLIMPLCDIHVPVVELSRL